MRDGLRQYVVEPLTLVYQHLNDAIWSPDTSPARRERRTKLVMISGVGVFALALMVVLLFVLPAMHSEAQGRPAPTPGAPPSAPTATPPGAPGAPGGGGPPSAPAPSAAPPAGPAQSPLELSRQNPFAPPAGEAALVPKQYKTSKTHYGLDWTQFPVGLRRAFIRPERGIHPAQGPSAADLGQLEEGAATGFRVSSILWTQGSPLATFETPGGETGTVGPGDVVHGWKVIEIGRNYLVVQNVKNPQATQRLALKTGK